MLHKCWRLFDEEKARARVNELMEMKVGAHIHPFELNKDIKFTYQPNK